jgi:hypothetical protein
MPVKRSTHLGEQAAPVVGPLVEGAIVTAMIQETPDAADVARDAAPKVVAEEKRA